MIFLPGKWEMRRVADEVVIARPVAEVLSTSQNHMSHTQLSISIILARSERSIIAP